MDKWAQNVKTRLSNPFEKKHNSWKFGRQVCSCVISPNIKGILRRASKLCRSCSAYYKLVSLCFHSQVRARSCKKKPSTSSTPTSSVQRLLTVTVSISPVTMSSGSAAFTAKQSSLANITTLTVLPIRTKRKRYGLNSAEGAVRPLHYVSSMLHQRTQGFILVFLKTGKTKKCGNLGLFFYQEVCILKSQMLDVQY